MARADRLAERILEVVERGPEADSSAFDTLWPDVFRYQYECNAPYRDFCDAQDRTPADVADWRDIPAYPTDSFKHEIVASFPMDDAVQALMTSGTTSPNQRGRIFRDALGQKLVFAANRVMTDAYLFPDSAEDRRCRVLILAPSPQLAPSMGMAVGMEQTRRHFGTEDSRFLVGRTGVNVRALVAALRESERTGVPVALIGATSAFVYFLKGAAKKGLRFRLPEGSRLGDGGGYRGRFGEMTRDDYYALVGEVLGVPEEMCANILGMAESATNYMDGAVRDRLLGRKASARRKPLPAWTRVLAVDPGTNLPLPDGEVGLLRHFDLANLPTVLAVQTDNLGYTDGRGGFEIMGRAKVVDGQVSELPSEIPAGPMGDKRVFRLLEAYVNFSIDFKLGRLASDQEQAGVAKYIELRKTADEQQGVDEGDPTASCPIAVDDIIASGDDPEAAERAKRAIDAFQADSAGDRESA